VALQGSSGDEVGALAVRCGGVGETTMLSIRPERVVLDAKPDQNPLPGKVLELIYLGDHIRCRLRVADSDEFVVKVPNSHEHSALQVGTETTVGWHTDDCRALEAA